MSPIITLTTDFGLQDPYVGMMKGAILSVHPAAVIVDITHHIEPQAVVQAAHVIHSAYSFFPAGTIHVAVVDPGVGSGRALLALAADGHIFLAPDNGTLTAVMAAATITACVRIENRCYFRPVISRTFHGRDILAPVAGHLAGGLSLFELGPSVPLEKAVVLNLNKARIRNEQEIEGTIRDIDRFGNLLTNIDGETLSAFMNHRPKQDISVEIGRIVLTGLQGCYQDVPTGQAAALMGSNGCLEIALNQGNAARRFNAKIGDMVRVSFPP